MIWLVVTEDQGYLNIIAIWIAKQDGMPMLYNYVNIRGGF